MAGFMTYWSKEYIRALKKAGDSGPLSVIFGSHHTKMPSISSVRVGDVIYPVTLADGTLHVMAKLPVEKIEVAFDYLMRETGGVHSALVPDGFAIQHKYHAGGTFYLTNTEKYEREEDLPEETNVLILEELEEKTHKFHQEPQTCCAALAASGTCGSIIKARPLPSEAIPELKFGPTRSKQKALRLDKNGIPTIVSLSGSVRRMSEETQRIFESVFSNE